MNCDIKECNVDLVASQQAEDKCISTNEDLNGRIKDITGKLKGCEDESHADLLEIIDLKSISNKLKEKLDKCDEEKCKITANLEICESDDTADYNALQKEIADQKATRDLLDQCNKRRTDIEESYKTECNKVLNLTTTINTIRGEFAESSRQYEEKINILIVNINEYETSIKTQTTIVYNLNIQITEITNQLNVSLKVSYLSQSCNNANSNPHSCPIYATICQNLKKK